MTPLELSLSSFSDAPLLRAELEKVRDLWSEPHRHYHDLSHLNSMLAHVSWLADEHPELDDRVALELAVWFHDAIYDATASDNEQQSADLARRSLEGLIDRETIDETARLVLLTAGHAVESGDSVGSAMVDADLAILGASPRDYFAYTEGVRLEYRHLDDDTFKQGRLVFLRSMLDRPRIYGTEPGHARWHDQARLNMSTELRDLTP
ncbi:MAG: metal-dependent phosphohydrolase [Actinomycetia bacterium]|nr:metal-dependent phosphohydrolase [Actinomycetes bacterium]